MRELKLRPLKGGLRLAGDASEWDELANRRRQPLRRAFRLRRLRAFWRRLTTTECHSAKYPSPCGARARFCRGCRYARGGKGARFRALGRGARLYTKAT